MVTTGTGGEDGEDCLGVVDPDLLVFQDGEGVERNLSIPAGTFGLLVTAGEFFGMIRLSDFLGSATASGSQ